jgi:hypothetical protein
MALVPRLASQRLPADMAAAFVFRCCCGRCGEVRLIGDQPYRGVLVRAGVAGAAYRDWRVRDPATLPIVELVGATAWAESHAEFRRARCRKPDLYGRYVTGLGDGASSAPGGAQAVEAAVPAGACRSPGSYPDIFLPHDGLIAVDFRTWNRGMALVETLLRRSQKAVLTEP